MVLSPWRAHVERMTETNPLLQIGDALASAVEQITPSLLRVEGARRPATATAWSEELAIIPTHVLGRRDEGFVVTDSGERKKATVIGRDPTSDVSLLRVEGGGLTPAPWDDGDDLKVGHLTIAAALPGPTARATLGMVSGLHGPWSTRLGAPMARLIDIDGELPRGFAGGPLLTADGKAVGMNTHGLMRGGTTVPTATLRRLVEQLEKHGEIRPGYIGVAVQAAALGEEAAKVAGRDRALLVTGVVDDGPAHQGGVVAGDLLIAAGDHPLQAAEELLAAIAGKTGDEVPFTLLRGTDRQEVTLAVGARPEGKRRERGRRGHGHGHGHGHRHERGRRRDN
jgi:S1-C subfamily serine protease